jgi:hypothetical protein
VGLGSKLLRLPFSRLVLLGAFVTLAASAAVDCSAKSYTTCTGLCQSVLPCNDSFDECLASCQAQQDKCEREGHPAVFLDYVACTTDAGFTCDDAGHAVANPPCGPSQLELIECESNNDATLPIPDGGYDATGDCVDAASCLGCCKDLFPKGASDYAKAVTACVCGEAGTCQSECADSACASPTVQPMGGSKCDLCLSAAINEQAADVGACVLPVTLACNQEKNFECAAYVNCVSQMGCTN